MTLIKSAVHFLWQHHYKCSVKMITFAPSTFDLKITRKFHSGYQKSYQRSGGGGAASLDRSPRGSEDRKFKAWNEAASVMIVAPMNNSLPYSLGYLMVERSRTGRVMPGNWVYPGGNFDSSDGDLQWITLYKDILSIDITQDNTFLLEDTAHHPQIYLDLEPQQQPRLPKQISLRITAIREAFEEAGVLLCRPGGKLDDNHFHNGMLHYNHWKEFEDKKEIQNWQKKVRKSGSEFLSLCRSLNCVPDLWGLHTWSNWLTPTVFKPRQRFDTMFYITLLPKMPRVVIDGNEAVNAQWISPSRVMQEHASKEIRLMPPQIYEFTRLSSLKTFEDLKERIRLRRKLGIERYCPVVKNATNGTLFLLPGDDMYPDPPDYLQMERDSLEEIPQSVEQLMKQSTNFHRGIAKKDDSGQMKYEINVQRYGNIY